MRKENKIRLNEMKDENKTKKQLIEELLNLRYQNTELELKETLRKQTSSVEKWTKDLFRDFVFCMQIKLG